MNAEKFRKAREEFLEHSTFDPKKSCAAIGAIEEAAAPEHVWENVGEGVCDQAKCSCGWTGRNFWDGADLAAEDWREHVADVLGLLEKECVCGKKYIPADGGKPCHKLVAT